MKKTVLIAVLAFLSVGLVRTTVALAQDDGPAPRYVTVTTFDVPFTDRGKVMPFIQKRFWPGVQLNPNIRNARILFHNWGSDASQIVMVFEHDSWNAIEADCGKPCDDWYEAHPAPEEGAEGYDDFREAQQLFSKYYSKHRDEIYLAPMEPAKVEGKNMGPIGGPADDE